jgi:hypothetical protein
VNTFLAFLKALSDIAVMVGKALPDDELKKIQFKIRSPLIYARVRQRILNRCRRRMKLRWHSKSVDVANYFGGGLVQEDRELLVRLLFDEFKR